MTLPPAAPRVHTSMLVARTLIGEYRVALDRMGAAFAAKEATGHDTFVAEADRVYGALWEQLDAAAALTAEAGRPTDAYRAVRTRPDLVLGAAVLDQRQSTAHVGTEYRGGKQIDRYRTTLHTDTNAHGVELARQAWTALATVWSELDWTEPADEPVPDLRPSGAGARLVRWFDRTFRGGR